MTDQAERLETLVVVTGEAKQDGSTSAVFGHRQLPRLLGRPRTVDVVGFVTLLAVVAVLWGRASSMSLWLDEGISVGVASHRLQDIPHLLLQDGSPPLYYLLLKGWVSVFGESNIAVHVLSLLFALATLPAALWAGWSLFGRRAGWMCALVVAINPFVAYYATETRMYSMATLLAIVSTTAFLHVFVFGRRRYLWCFALSQALLMYTHNWGLLLGLGAGVALVPLFLLTDGRRRFTADALLGFGGVALLYAPWVPSLTYQVGQHLQPWGRKGDLVWVRDDVARMMGGDEAFVALGLGAGIGLAALLQRRGRSQQAMAVAVIAIIAGVTLAAGWRESVWAYRYLAVVVGPLVLLASVGLARSGRAGLAGLGVAAFLTAPLAVRGPAYQKSNAEAVSAELSPQLQPGDLVILPDFQMVPLIAHYLPPGLRYATASGLVPDRNIVDWRNSMDRLINDDPMNTLPPLIDALPMGGQVVVMCPPPESEADGSGLAQVADRARATTGAVAVNESVQPETTPLPKSVTFHPLILLRCQQAESLVSRRPDLEVKKVLTPPSGIRYTSVGAQLLIKRPPPPLAGG